MHKRMQALSLRVAQLPESKRTADLLDDLYESQANDAYWHGLFGGLYLPHLRRAVYNAIVRLEAKLDRIAPRKAAVQADCDKDGIDEFCIFNNELQAIVKLDGYGGICEFDDYRLNHNFGDTLRRQAEHYFEKIHKHKHGGTHSSEGIASAHDRIAFKHEISSYDLLIDHHPHGLFIDSWLREGERLSIQNYVLVKSNPVSMQFHTEIEKGAITKTVTLIGNRIEAQYTAKQLKDGVISVRLLLAMPCCDGYAGRYIAADKRILGGFGTTLEVEDTDRLILDDGVLGGHLILGASRSVAIHAAPYFTVSQSEAGFEKIMQAVEVTVQWPAGDSPVDIWLEVNPGNLKL